MLTFKAISNVQHRLTMAIYRYKVFEILFEDPHPWMTIPTRRVGGGVRGVRTNTLCRSMMEDSPDSPVVS